LDSNQHIDRPAVSHGADWTARLNAVSFPNFSDFETAHTSISDIFKVRQRR
jgi:hypothetical protein